MASLRACPRCGRTCKKTLTSSWFPVHACRDCRGKYCNECSQGSGPTCPECGSSRYSTLDQVHAP